MFAPRRVLVMARAAGTGTGAGYPELSAALAYTAKPFSTDFRFRLPNRYLLAALLARMGLTPGTVSWNSVSWNDVSWNDVWQSS